MSDAKSKAKNLSDEQAEVVRHPVDQNAVVIAVAGSGKSTTLVERMAYLIEGKHALPSEIIAVMFNASAANDMAESLVKRLTKRSAPQSVTYHRLGTLTLKILIDRGIALNWKFDASIPAATKFAARAIAPFLESNDVKSPRFTVDAFMGFVDRVKADLADPDQVFEDGEWSANQEWFPLAYKAYEKLRQQEGLRFFSDLIYDPVMLIKNDPRAAAVVSGRFKHIIVDEYQDICESQQALIRAVAGDYARVMVVGDDDQTIYTWRGANPSYILRDFTKDFGGMVYKLSRTWRYGHNLSCAANYLITNNEDRADKLCISGPSTPRTQIILVQGHPDSVIKSLRPLLATNEHKQPEDRLKYGDIAILVRAYSRSGKAQLELLEAGIPYRLEGGEKMSVLENDWVKMMMGWMGLVLGDIAAQPYAGEPDYGSIMQMKEILSRHFFDMGWESHSLLCKTVLMKPKNATGFSFFANNHLESWQRVVADQIRNVSRIWVNVLSQEGIKALTPYEFLKKIHTDFHVPSRIKEVNKRDEDAETQTMLVQSFLDYAKQFDGNLRDFIEHVDSLKSFSDEAKASVDAVHITSIHRSKGLEWPVVFMVGLVQGKFPMAARKKEDGMLTAKRLEDERRLFYVAMTRVRSLLYMVAPLDNGVAADEEASLNTKIDYVQPEIDGHLMTRLKGGGAKAPFSLLDTAEDSDVETDSTGRPSQFIYEANHIIASEMSEFVSAPTPLKRQTANPRLFNAYLEAVGSKRRIGHLPG